VQISGSNLPMGSVFKNLAIPQVRFYRISRVSPFRRAYFSGFYVKVGLGRVFFPVFKKLSGNQLRKTRFLKI
jgi:hypothetical protein